MYWLSADSTERQAAEDWPAYCERSRTEVLDRFQQIVARTDFVQEARRWFVLKSEMERGFDVIPTLVFVQFSNSRPNFELTGCANASVNADGMTKFSINNFEATLVASSPPRC